MARSNLEKFKLRLILVDYFRHCFGVTDIHDPKSVRAFYRDLAKRRDGYSTEGRSFTALALTGLVKGIKDEDLRRYDANIKKHIEKINRVRTTETITFKYFQILPALMSEYYFDRLTSAKDTFLADLNAFAEKQNEARRARINYPKFTSGDLNKLAYWMATGSGKTLLMHLNYYQYLDYVENASLDEPENIILITPNAGLSQQHITEMRKSGIPCQGFNAATPSGIFSNQPHSVKVIEITKLTDKKTGQGKSVEVDAFEGRNLVFVDEGHKGAGGEAWFRRRDAIAQEGFTFEYSATFGQGIGGSAAEIEEDYGRAIIFDYSYPRFYEDGYGKDYRILNLEHDFADPSLMRRYLLANLLTFYEQIHIYTGDRNTFQREYNLEPPLLTFIGHSVTAGKTWSTLGRNDMRSLSDVQRLVVFLHNVLQNQAGWVPQAIDIILSGKSGLKREDGSDIFEHSFSALRAGKTSGKEIYGGMLRYIFHVDASAPLHLINLKTASGEIGLRAGSSDRFFGLINIGDDANFIRLMRENAPEVITEEGQFGNSLFRSINKNDSPITVLLGAKKFIEGWDSWRVSSMGLMNIGRGEGPQIIQLFGRGVRLLGKDRSLKRSAFLKIPTVKIPANLPILETLSIFGVRAKYMEKFRKYLREEGIDVDESVIIKIDTVPGPDFEDKDLITIRSDPARTFEKDKYIVLRVDADLKPSVDLRPRSMLTDSKQFSDQPGEYQAEAVFRYFSSSVLDLLDWDHITKEVWKFAKSRQYQRNLSFDKKALRRVLDETNYELECNPSILAPKTYADITRIEQIVLMILRKYIQAYYSRAHRHWEQSTLRYQNLSWSDANLITEYEARVKSTAEELLERLENFADKKLYKNDTGLPNRVHFDRHLYLPLLEGDAKEPPIVKYSPPGLNKGEKDFLKKLRKFVT
ncbi:MAG: DEAD/DEAH box helicase family protein, partial [Chloroflexota bacterium]|nr:DEAD/DEAH box helicase family protein [Chloroflexota bacterium]